MRFALDSSARNALRWGRVSETTTNAVVTGSGSTPEED